MVKKGNKLPKHNTKNISKKHQTKDPKKPMRKRKIFRTNRDPYQPFKEFLDSELSKRQCRLKEIDGNIIFV